MQSIMENAGTIVVTLALISIVAAVIVKLRKDKKRGKSACGCNCGCCPMASECHKQQ